ncbi:MAG: YjbH domain-containing protein [Bacteroidales bacterium]|nr:YjbH domain-containing protein [Bacteroidales bacterium]
MKKILIIVIYFYSGCIVTAQPTAGTTGLLNSPSASMPADGTFSAGFNYLPDIVTPQPKFNYNTFNYYAGMAFLPFLELSFRMTLLKRPNEDNYFNQDRSLEVRLRLLKEHKWLPSVVIGGNDLYSTTLSGNKYFKSLFIVGTKSFNLGNNIAGVSLGYAPGEFIDSNISGVFGGVTFSPSFLKSLSLIAEYDTRYFNAGASILLFRHIFLYGFSGGLKQFSGGIAFRLYAWDEEN